MDKTEIVESRVLNKAPADYHCACPFCSGRVRVLQRRQGAPYSRLERRKYYSELDVEHFAKTPLHVARWAVQAHSQPGDWVLDPTAGAGTTLVEAVNHGRNAVGVEIQFIDVIKANVQKQIGDAKKPKYHIAHGDARELKRLVPPRIRYSLVVNNPPYSGDRQDETGYKDRKPEYDPSYANLGLLNEGRDYWTAMTSVYEQCVDLMKPGGRFLVGVKDMVRNKEPLTLHRTFGELLASLGLRHVETALLLHHPTTHFMNTYPKRFPDVKIPLYQTILVFRKD